MSEKIKSNISLLELNTFHIPVKASHFIELNSVEDYKEVNANPDYRRMQKLILGGGSNILFTKDFTGLVLKNSIKGIQVINEDEDFVYVESGGGEEWDDLVSYTVDNNYWGIENLSLIPGSVGAAPVQNIGAYGVELYDVFHYAEGFYLFDMEMKKFYRGDCEFGYRSSLFKKRLKNEFLITKVVLKLSKTPNPELSYGNLKAETEKLTEEVTPGIISEIVKKIRNTKLPDVNKYGNAGSFFKNPVIGKSFFDELKELYDDLIFFKADDNNYKIPAGWLIEKTGWKGTKFGNVGSYSKQALVIINYGEASGNEVLNFAKMIKESVEEKFGIRLEEEVNIY